MKDRQYTDKIKKDRWTNNDLKCFTRKKTKYCATQISLKTGCELGCSGRVAYCLYHRLGKNRIRRIVYILCINNSDFFKFDNYPLV